MADAPKRRLILVDENVRCLGGHFFELMALLADGASKIGYRVVMATHTDFEAYQSEIPQVLPHHQKLGLPAPQLFPIFQTRRLLTWSMGVDGHSNHPRLLNGNVDGNWLARTHDSLRSLTWPGYKRPKTMLRSWRKDFIRLVEHVNPKAEDRVLINTADDFSLLALGEVLRQPSIPPLKVDALVHFALASELSSTTERTERLAMIGKQIRSSVSSVPPHEVKLFATTDALTRQYRSADPGVSVRTIAYPTRAPDQLQARRRTPKDRLQILLPGLPRAEKGRDSLSQWLENVRPLVDQGRWGISMQLPRQGWREWVPKVWHQDVAAMEDASNHPNPETPNHRGRINVRWGDLSPSEYHLWLATADAALLMYDPVRYAARCSGVLLEMMIRGIPVIVPDQCHLSETLKEFGGHRAVGMIYEDESQLIDMMSQLERSYDDVFERCQSASKLIRQRHDAVETLSKMGFIRPEAAAA